MEKVIQVTRIFTATPEQVWKTWTEAELVKRWWGPDVPQRINGNNRHGACRYGTNDEVRADGSGSEHRQNGENIHPGRVIMQRSFLICCQEEKT
jgi:uncharacterized protein YndB with AHSA1/START domain